MNIKKTNKFLSGIISKNYGQHFEVYEFRVVDYQRLENRRRQIFGTLEGRKGYSARHQNQRGG
jgi:hypothetical protein